MRHTPTFQVLTQPILLAGCEREPAVVLFGGMMICFAIAWFTWSVLALGVGVFLAMFGFPALRWMASCDVLLMKILARFVTYRRHYPAHAIHRRHR
jgi:type IV secretory pathway TrbD component